MTDERKYIVVQDEDLTEAWVEEYQPEARCECGYFYDFGPSKDTRYTLAEAEAKVKEINAAR